MPMFTRAEMNMHISKSGKHIDPHSKSHSVPTSMRNAKTFLEDKYLNDLSVASDQVHFLFKSKCHHSFRKNDPPHNLKVALDLVSGNPRSGSIFVSLVDLSRGRAKRKIEPDTSLLRIVYRPLFY